MRPVDTPLGISSALPAGIAPDWWLVAALTVTAVAGSVAGARLAARTDTARLSAAFTGLVLLVAAYTAAIAVPALT